MINIETATSSDLLNIATIHVNSYKSAYRGILNDQHLDNLQIEGFHKMWQNTHHKFPENLFIARLKDEVIGFCCAGEMVEKEKNHPYEFEVYGLHVSPQFYRNKTGTKLLAAAFSKAKKQQMNSSIIWTLKDLKPSRQFYERMGGRAVRSSSWNVKEKAIPEVAYGWSDLKKWNEQD